jgi:hypothetical protein
MAYEIGTATGYTDLLDRLVDFLTNPARVIESGDTSIDELEPMPSGEFWTALQWNDNRDSSGVGECSTYLRGPGSAGVDEIFVYIDTYSDVGEGYYNWRLCGMTGYSSGVDISFQPGRTKGRLPRMLLHNSFIDYWFLGNGRRFVVTAKVSTIYECCYGGFVLPYGLPSQFPYPLTIGGSAAPTTTASHHKYTQTEVDHRAFVKPYGYNQGGVCSEADFDYAGNPSRGTLKIIVGDTWIFFDTTTGSACTNVTWPYSHLGATSTSERWSDLKENIDGSFPVFPITVMMNDPSKNIVGELQGCFAIPGFKTGVGLIEPEDTFTINGNTYIAFPVKFSADRSNFWCMKKE